MYLSIPSFETTHKKKSQLYQIKSNQIKTSKQSSEVMDRPIFRNYMNLPSGAAPVRPAQPNSARKVVSIPVHFVGSDTRGMDTRRSTSAVKIQKVFRGYLVRKSMKEIVLIGREVDEVERRISGALDLIRRDAKERLRMNETLMGLLFKLDSVRGVGPGVRDCRKAAIKKAIALQEKIDGADQEILEAEGQGEFGTEHQTNDSINSNQDLDIEDVVDDPEVAHEQSLSEKATRNIGAEMLDRALEIEGSSNFGTEDYAIDSMNTNQDLDIEDMSNQPQSAKEENLSEKAEQALDTEVKASGIGIEGVAKIEEPNYNCNKFTNLGAEEDDYCIVKQVMAAKGEEYDSTQTVKQAREDCNDGDAMLKMQADEAKPVKEETLKDREIMERMVEENAKMMSMMRELFEQNQAQSQTLTSLSQRLDQLEKAFVCEGLCKKTKEDFGQNQAESQMLSSISQRLDLLEKALICNILSKKACKKKRTANGVTDRFDCRQDQKKCE